MKEHPTKIVEKIHAILDVLDECNTKGNSLVNYDATARYSTSARTSPKRLNRYLRQNILQTQVEEDFSCNLNEVV